ncbi:MAG: family 10 glycosylhydrolase [Nitrososphaeria archaeon]
MYKRKCYALLGLLVVLCNLCIFYTIASLTNTITIKSTGRLATALMGPKSEIRGVFVHCATFSYPVDWNVIAETLKGYKINAVFGEFLSFGEGYYGNSPYGDQLGMAIAACHARGIEVHAVMTFFYQEVSSKYRAVDHAGKEYTDWVCPTKQAVRNVIKSQVEYVASHYDIDGFMFDYIRYDTDDMCYCSECRAKFQEWLGEGTITNWQPFYPGGSRQKEFLEWRITSITAMVKDVRDWISAIKPNITFSIAAWTLFQDSPTYWRYWLGQDTADWVGKGYLDMVAPMMYTTDLSEIQDYIQTDFKYMVGGPEGKVPLVALITTGVESPVAPSAFKAVVDKVRQLGADGWIIWRYGGPGVQSGGDLIDIRPYLNLIDLPDVFTISFIQASATQTGATITWITDLPTTSIVEYSTSPLFTASFKYHQIYGFNYWDIDHILGIIVQNLTLTTTHTIKLEGLQPGTKYYFRVQSQGTSGIATSKVMTFTTSTS